jgi:predicted PurR-regulated permease PerM
MRCDLDPAAVSAHPSTFLLGTQMGRQASFWMLVVVAVAIGVLFFKVIQPFLLPLLLGTVVTMLIRPYYEWAVVRLGQHRRLVALLFAILFLLLVLLPLIFVIFIAGRELLAFGKEQAAIDWNENRHVVWLRSIAEKYFTNAEWDQVKKSTLASVQSLVQGIYKQTQALLTNLLNLLLALIITSLSLYYFLAEGPDLVVTLRRLSPLNDRDEELLLQDFSKVCRGVVLATLVCAFFQACAAGVGFALVGVNKVWLLAVLTMFTSMIPFVGAAAVWLPVSIQLILSESWGAGLFLIFYGCTVVSSMDNLLRAYVIHDSAQLHPLVALISVLGAVKILGLWGILVGPIVASFFYAVLKILRDRHWDAASPAPPSPTNPLC